MIERRVQAAEMGVLRRVHGVKLRDKVPSCKIDKALNVEPHLRIVRSQQPLVRQCDQNVRGKIGAVSPAGYTLGLQEKSF